MKILFDQNVPRPLARFLTNHTVVRASELGWERLRNGNLLDVAEAEGFDVMVSGDQGLKYQQNMTGRRIAVVGLSANNWPVVEPHVQAIVEALDFVQPGTVVRVECGVFRRLRDRFSL